MAGTKINTKKKEDKSKLNKGIGQGVEENEDIDFSLLRKPILTSITGFAQARKVFDQATEELKSLLTNECDLLYECKVCRNLFRSLANFISHKRVYCKECFNTSIHGHFIKETCTIQEVFKIRKLEESYQESLAENNNNQSVDEEENEDRIPMSKDLTEILEQIVKSKGVKDKQIKDQKLSFQKIPDSSVAVFQSIDTRNSSTDNMRTQVKELDEILSQEKAVLQSDGTFKVQSNVSTENVIQISDDDENEDTDALKCKICDLQFSTLKTLKFHMKYKHVESRLVYPCPDCVDIFSTSWSVYRHLFKVHRKTAAQIRRLRESIQAKAFRLDNPPAFYEKRKTVPKVVPPQKITEEERLDQENQAWLEELDGEGSGRRCVCGRTFERRAALAAHAHTCARRQRRRIGIQIRKDYHKEQANPFLSGSARESKVAPSVTEEITPVNKTDDKVTNKRSEETAQLEEELTVIDQVSNEQEDDKDMVSDISNIETPFFFDSTFMYKLPFAQQAEKSNLNAFKQKLLLHIDKEQLMCKKCNTKHNEMNELINHMAEHYKWIRYACKLCNFKHFIYEKLPEHVKVVHKLKGDTDFYYSTVKAVDGTEALELADFTDETNEGQEVSPDSRRPSRCSSDSSRLSDDSSSSSVKVEVGSRKRKANKYRNNAKKKKEDYVADDVEINKEEEVQKEKDIMVIDNDSSSNSKVFEENSSDFDEIDEKISKRQSIENTSVASRRPVRKKTKLKNEDFEYDLSNLLKMEAQGYRGSQAVAAKSQYYRRRSPQEVLQHYEMINKDCCGALITLSWKSAGKSQCHMQTTGVFSAATKESRVSNIFARPMVPKATRTDKLSPKKDEKDIKESSPRPVKITELPKSASPQKIESKIEKQEEIVKQEKEKQEAIVRQEEKEKQEAIVKQEEKEKQESIVKQEEKEKQEESEQQSSDTTELEVPKDVQGTPINDIKNEKVVNECNKDLDIVQESKNVDSETKKSLETTKPNVNVPIVPIKFRRQSLEVIKNPLIKKNIKDFTKAGMKTKILVIKPINRSSDGTSSLATPLKFQTIKLKDATKPSSNEEKKDKLVVVKVPKVECAITKPVSNISSNVISPIISEAKNIATENKVIEDKPSNEVDKVPEKINDNSPELVLCNAEPVAEVEAPVDSHTIVNLEGC